MLNMAKIENNEQAGRYIYCIGMEYSIISCAFTVLLTVCDS